MKLSVFGLPLQKSGSPILFLHGCERKPEDIFALALAGEKILDGDRVWL